MKVKGEVKQNGHGRLEMRQERAYQQKEQQFMNMY